MPQKDHYQMFVFGYNWTFGNLRVLFTIFWNIDLKKPSILTSFSFEELSSVRFYRSLLSQPLIDLKKSHFIQSHLQRFATINPSRCSLIAIDYIIIVIPYFMINLHAKLLLFKRYTSFKTSSVLYLNYKNDFSYYILCSIY